MDADLLPILSYGGDAATAAAAGTFVVHTGARKEEKTMENVGVKNVGERELHAANAPLRSPSLPSTPVLSSSSPPALTHRTHLFDSTHTKNKKQKNR